MEINGAKQMYSSILPMPANSDRCRTMSASAPRDASDTGSIAVGIILMIIAGPVLFLLPVFIIGFTTACITIGAILFMIALVYGIRIIIRANFNYSSYIKDFFSNYLQPGEEFIAFSPIQKLGMSLWLTGISKQGLIIFTSHRLFLVTLDGKKMGLRTMNNFLKKGTFDEIIHEIFVADYSETKQVCFGGAMFPPVMHLSSIKIKIKPEGKEDYSSWAMMCKATNNGKAIKAIFNR